MKSVKFWAGLVLLLLMICAPFALGEAAHEQSLDVGSHFIVPASLLTFTFAPGGSFHGSKPANSPNGWGGNGGGGGCGQGGNGGWGGNGGGNGCCGGNGGGGNGNGGWGGNGGGNGGCGVPEGGNSLEYLALGAFACITAMVYRVRRQSAACETK